MGEGTDAARAAVLTARASVEEELVQLEASARAAVDVKAKVRRHPGRAAGLAAGAGFLLLGGPRRTVRGVRRVIFGKRAALPPSMLPRDIDRALRELGDDGDRVRGTIEREFAEYLRATAPARKKRDFSGMAALMLASVGRPLVDRYGRRLVEQLLDFDPQTGAAQLAKVRARYAGPATAKAPANANTSAAAEPAAGSPVTPRAVGGPPPGAW